MGSPAPTIVVMKATASVSIPPMMPSVTMVSTATALRPVMRSRVVRQELPPLVTMVSLVPMIVAVREPTVVAISPIMPTVMTGFTVPG
jgi:hypothetical protein